MARGSDDLLTWEEIAERLAPPRNYWLVTADADDGAHAAPVWGAVHWGDLYCFTTRSTRKARNLARDNRAVVHLESGDDVVIVHGRMVDVGEPSAWPDVVRSFHAKYDQPDDAEYLPSLDPGTAPTHPIDVLYRLEPRRALLWFLSDFDGSQMRWSS